MADLECILKGVKSSDKNNGSYTEKYQDHIFAALLTKLLVLVINSVKKLFFTQEEMLFTGSLKQFLKSMIIVKKMMKKHFNRNIIMSAEEEERFQLTNSCWIYDKLFNVGDNTVRDPCHITGKYRGAAN